jgi:hypothetical protein
MKPLSRKNPADLRDWPSAGIGLSSRTEVIQLVLRPDDYFPNRKLFLVLARVQEPQLDGKSANRGSNLADNLFESNHHFRLVPRIQRAYTQGAGMPLV